ncbi:c-type cytochrome [Luteolibacter sp. GHJ8]|uniref:C-type cytochrome n=1 Tax=Luteolibacter rhizosphaerae TaxID=2989719 RepID=A0ABT3G5Z9_9BACT|nr:c-type cytochrome [Luteolibacter rhizosphaerae]MCW1914926.1 c-type cytochrome [Luteolibacter rhizosphaerae]
MRDTNEDGLEDWLDTFAPETSDNYPVGMVVKDGMPHALLADEIVRFRDTDHDGIPDKRETVAKGWDDPALRDDPLLMHRRVDSAMAIAAGPDDDWYVTMGSANPGNGYWQKAEGDVWAPDAVKTGAPAYSPDKRRGCLLRITKDGKVEQLASGLRYIMSLQWDRHGELFATDQEGATWLPNGNPFDELLHLQTGRHYGFPPRHPKLLPDVVDEPSVWDFAPQHQSTCGFRFNGPAKDRPRFGPEFWAHDAIITGESRGKLWRTSLAKTSAGYVASTQLFAALGMLVTDCAISPQGDLVICCHSGPPDWGKGPSHEGRLFKIRHMDSTVPQPVLTWASDECTTVVGFDRALEGPAWDDLASRIRIEGGPQVAAGDRFEAIRPGYAVVRGQMAQPRYRVLVESALIGEDGRSIVIKTAPRREAFGYAITLDAPRHEAGIPQAQAIDLAHSLNGLEASWSGAEGSSWKGWLPHPDFSVVGELTRSSAVHADAIKDLTRPGALHLRTKLNLSHLLQPATQPGSKLDYAADPEVVTITVKSDAAIALEAPGLEVIRKGLGEASFTKTVAQDPWQELSIHLPTPASPLEITFHTSIDPRPRAMGVGRFFMPFATPAGEPAAVEVTIPEIAGGDWERGRQIFFGKAACFTCHQFNGEGHAVGPDLSNTIHRDYAAVLRDIQDPSAAINPDAVAYKVDLKDGGSLVGVRVGETASSLKFAVPGGQVIAVEKANLAASSALEFSLMPPGLTSALSEQEIKDLMTFLLQARERDH